MDRLASNVVNQHDTPRVYRVEARVANGWVFKGQHDQPWMADKQVKQLKDMGFPRVRICEVIQNEDR